MYQLKGFIGFETLVSNVVGVTAPIGEISTYSMTFAKDKGIFTFSTNRAITLYSFSSKSDATGPMDVPATISNMALTISDWIYTRQTTLGFQESKEDFLAAFSTQFILTCDGMNSGEMIESNGGHWFPEWITWKNRDYITENNGNKIWFSDDSFRREYDEFEITVIPPITNVDSFFQISSAVTAEVNSRTFSAAIELIRIARNTLPETILASESFDYVNPNNATNKVPTNWSILIYGPAGNNEDVIINSIIDYILAHTTHTLNEWKVIFPDIFKRTEFTILPRWNNYAIPNLTLQAGIYSPVVNLTKEIAYLQSVLPEYTLPHIANHATMMFNPYKSLAMDVIGSFENRDNLFEITQIFPDIISVSTTSPDFNRMSAETQGFLNLLSNMIPLAERMTINTDIPIGMRRTVRNGVIYITANYLKVQYLIASKGTTPAYS